MTKEKFTIFLLPEKTYNLSFKRVVVVDVTIPP